MQWARVTLQVRSEQRWFSTTVCFGPSVSTGEMPGFLSDLVQAAAAKEVGVDTELLDEEPDRGEGTRIEPIPVSIPAFVNKLLVEANSLAGTVEID